MKRGGKRWRMERRGKRRLRMPWEMGREMKGREGDAWTALPPGLIHTKQCHACVDSLDCVSVSDHCPVFTSGCQILCAEYYAKDCITSCDERV